MRRERSQSLNPSSLAGRGGLEEAAAADPLKPVAPGGTSAAAKNTLEEIVTNTFRTFVQVIVQARSQRLGGHDASSPQQRHDVFSPEASTWLNYYLDCLWAVDEDLTQFWRDWKRNERRSAIDLTLDVFAQLPNPGHPTGGHRGTPQHRSMQPRERELTLAQPFLLERWLLSFNAKPNVDARHNTINVKKTAMVLRSVGSIVRALPAHKLVRLRRKQPTSFSIDYALYPSVCASLSMPSLASSSRCEWTAAAGRQSMPFSSVVSRTGTFTVSVEYATNLPSFKFQALKIEPFVITDYVPSTTSDNAARGEQHTLEGSRKESTPISPRGIDMADRSARDRKSLERATSLPVFLPSSSPMQPIPSFGHAPPMPAIPPTGRAPPSSAIPIRGASTSTRTRGNRGGTGEEDLDAGGLAFLGSSTSPPKMSPVCFTGGLVSPSTSAGGPSRGMMALGSAGKGNGNFFNVSTPPFTREFFLLHQQQQQQQQQSFPRSSPSVGPQAITPFLDEKGSSSPWEATGTGSSASRSLEASGSFSEALFPALLPPCDDAGEIPGLLETNHPASQPAFAIAMQENEVRSFLDSCAHPPDLKMFSQHKNMVASFADELRSLGAEGTEELETLSRSLRRLSTDMGDVRKHAPSKPGRDAPDDETLFFDM